MKAESISVVVPLLNEKQNLPELLEHLGHFSFSELIFVDGGSQDGSWQWLTEQAKQTHINVLQAAPSRAQQMNAGAEVATSETILFLHADTRLPNQVVKEITSGLLKHVWGRFDLRFLESDLFMASVAKFINFRSRLSGVATGDQAIFVNKVKFVEIGGFENIPLMEDVALSKVLLAANSKPYCSREKVATSARRWLQNGRIKTVISMWRLRWSYFRGVAPEDLVKEYRDVR